MDKVFRSGDGTASPRVRSLAEAQKVMDRSRALFLALHELANELHLLSSIDELYLKAVLMGRSQLDIDRMGILLMDAERKWITGTYGTDERGNTTDERGFVAPFPDRDRLLHSSLKNRNYVVYQNQRTIYHMEQAVGQGWHAMYALWDGDTPIGFIACDNLLTGRPLGFFQKELFGLFGSSIGSLILRKRYEAGLVEKVSTLNRIVSKVAHEINTPLAAITSSNQTIREQLRKFGFEAPQALGALPGPSRDLLRRLLEGWTEGAVVRVGKERRALRRQWEDRLRQEAFPDGPELAEKLEQLAVGEPRVTWEEIRATPGFRTVLHWASQMADILGSTQTMDKATAKIGKFVQYLRPANALPSRDLPVVEPVAILHDVVREARATWNRCPEILVDDVGGLQIQASAEDLAVVWEHLLRNAAQETEPGGTVWVRFRTAASQVTVEIEDHGKGISEEHSSQIFRPFFTTKAELEGLGLGLTFCKTIVESYGGSLTFESNPGRTVFRVALPLVLSGRPDAGSP